MRTIALRAARGFWHEGKHIAKGELILVPANKARELQQAGKGTMILTRYPGRLDRGPVTFDGPYAYEDDQVYVRPEDEPPGWTPKDEDCVDCPKKAKGKTEAKEKPKKKRKKKVDK